MKIFTTLFLLILGTFLSYSFSFSHEQMEKIELECDYEYGSYGEYIKVKPFVGLNFIKNHYIGPPGEGEKWFEIVLETHITDGKEKRVEREKRIKDKE